MDERIDEDGKKKWNVFERSYSLKNSIISLFIYFLNITITNII